jgi:hypothetical protein
MPKLPKPLIIGKFYDIMGSSATQYITGWWYTYPSEKFEFVSWEYDIPNWMET